MCVVHRKELQLDYKESSECNDILGNETIVAICSILSTPNNIFENQQILIIQRHFQLSPNRDDGSDTLRKIVRTTNVV